MKAKLSKEDMAARINGREYRDEMTAQDSEDARESGLFVIYGASDDLVEIDGLSADEMGCYGGGELYLTATGVAEMPDEDEQEVLAKFGVLEQVKCAGRKVQIHWDKDGYSWTYETDVPHATFEILDDGEKYCRGIVIDAADLENTQPAPDTTR